MNLRTRIRSLGCPDLSTAVKHLSSMTTTCFCGTWAPTVGFMVDCPSDDGAAYRLTWAQAVWCTVLISSPYCP